MSTKTKSQKSKPVEIGEDANENDERSFRIIEELQAFGINVSDIKKLQDHGIVTVGSVLQLSTREMLTIKGFTEAKIEKIKEVAKKLDTRGGFFKSGVEVKERRNHVMKITTGINNYIDFLLFKIK